MPFSSWEMLSFIFFMLLSKLLRALVHGHLGDLDLMFLGTQFGGFSHGLYDLCLLAEVVCHLGCALDKGLMHVLEQSLVWSDLLDHALQCKELRHAP